jgi:hypothetical protein
MSALSSIKVESNYTGTFTKQNSVSFDPSLWAATNGTINWSDYPSFIPYTESDVFHTQLTHTAGLSADIGWTIRVGKGGHIYYIDVEGLGQIICPNRYFSPWNDDCMTTTVFSHADRNEDPEMGGHDTFANGYLHGSGMYIKPDMDPLNNKPFYCPILGENFDPNDRSYSIINWGLVPKPNINRGDVLFYSRYRDIGNGVLEITFYCYNFGDRTYTFAETPWFAVRPSKFPNMVEGISGTSSFKKNNKTFQSGAISREGGWGAFTVDPNNSNSTSCAMVWGSATTSMGVNFGYVDRGERDMALIAPSKSGFTMPYGTGIRYRRYVVFGKLANVANICSKLNQHAFFEKIEFSKEYSGKLPIYQKVLDGQTVLSTVENGSPIMYTHPIPVNDSLPLLLMKNKETGIYVLSTDPYAICGKKAFINPYPVGHPKYNDYQNKHIYQPYDGKTEWVSLLGFVRTSDITDSGYDLLSNLIGSIPFLAGEQRSANQLKAYPV